MSPEVSSLGKHGTYDVNLYTGAPNIGLPLHTVTEGNLQIPISLSYDASGFIPNKDASCVGLNWELTAGGAITRVVHGVPDEKFDSQGFPLLGEHKGHIYGQLRENLSYPEESMRKIDYLNVSELNSLGFSPSYSIGFESTPDIFSFNFLGHSGKFFMDNQGHVHVISDHKYKVDLQEFNTIYSFAPLLGTNGGAGVTVENLNRDKIISRIKITSDDGYVFSFGGTFKEMEVSFQFTSSLSRAVSPTSGVINAWYLTKVESPEGDITKFDYIDFGEDDVTVIQNLFETGSGNYVTKISEFFEVKIYENQNRSYVKKNGSTIIPASTARISKTLIKHSYLNKITTNLQSILFSYMRKERFYVGNIPDFGILGATNVNVNQNYYTKKISSILIKDYLNSDGLAMGYLTFPTIKNITFNQSIVSNRLFLNSCSINGLAHTFTYFNPNSAIALTLPDPLTRGVDILGYYNGKDDNANLMGDPENPYGTDGEFEPDFTSQGHNRQPYAPFSNLGILKQITYPTGGVTGFEFENHDYKKVLKRRVSAGIVQNLEPLPAATIAGGLRIAKIINSPGVATTYRYLNNFNTANSSGSSGILVYPGVYIEDFTAPNFIHREVSDNTIIPSASYAESPISYSEVITSNTEGYTKTNFTNIETNPDTYYLGDDSYKETVDWSSSNYIKQLKRMMVWSSRSDERGKVSSIKIYNSLNQELESEEYNYNTDVLRGNSAERTIGTSSSQGIGWNGFYQGLFQSYALYFYHNLITRITKKSYTPGVAQPIEKVSTFKYKTNVNPYLEEKTVSESDESGNNISVIKYKYKYPEDFASTSTVYQSMVNKFILFPVVEEKVFKNNTLLYTNTHNYSGFLGNTIYKIASEKTINEYLSPGNEQTNLSVLNYTGNGMISEVQKNKDYPITYIWDYKGIYPIAEVSNANSAATAYTSFEADGTGGWNFNSTGIVLNYSAPTGKKYYKLSSGAMSASFNTSKPYILSYWSQSGQYNVSGTQSVKQGTATNGWIYYEHEINNTSSLTITGGGFIDEVRLYPKNGSMKTYTYEPLVGVTSQCDINNKIIYYNYDQLGRLSLIRDQNKNILKKFCYNLLGQQGDCLSETESLWQATGKIRCKVCSANPIYLSGMQEHEESDANPSSPSFNTTRWVDDEISGSCVVVADWQFTGNVRCNTETIYDSHNVGTTYNTGYQDREQIDMNPCSSTPGSNTRWITGLQNCTTCPTPAVWVQTSTSCELNANGNITGNQIINETNTESCSSNYGATRTRTIYNPTACN